MQSAPDQMFLGERHYSYISQKYPSSNFDPLKKKNFDQWVVEPAFILTIMVLNTFAFLTESVGWKNITLAEACIVEMMKTSYETLEYALHLRSLVTCNWKITT